MTAVVIRGDARALPLPDASVDLIVTSPPYFALRDYEDGSESLAGQIGQEETPQEYVTALLDCTREWMRVLKPTGSLWVNLGDKYDSSTKGGASSSQLLNSGPEKLIGKLGKRRPVFGRPKSLMGLPWRYALACIDDLGLILRAEVIWSKTSGMPESVTDRVRRMHEQWFHFTKEPRYYADADEIRQPSAAPERKAGRSAFRARNLNHARTGTGAYEGQNPLGALPGSVWEIAAQPLRVPEDLEVDHYAAFPMEWPRRIVLGWSPPGGVVADPFGGTGTAALVASVLGRTGITVDRSADYCRIAQWRTQDPRERARALGVKPPEPVAPEQAALFGEAS